MVVIRCHSNIDFANKLKWPSLLPESPQVGDLIRSESSTKEKYIEMEVVRRTWIKGGDYNLWFVDIELWMIRSRWHGIHDFERWVNHVLSGIGGPQLN